MTKENLLNILQTGVDDWNDFRKKKPNLNIHLNGSNLSGANLPYANLSHAYLMESNLTLAIMHKSDLSRADLTRSDLIRTDLRNSNLHRCDLSYANLTLTQLQNSDLSNTNLCNARLWNTDLSGCDLTNATFGSTTFGDVNLKNVIGLHTAKHYGPSCVSTVTLRKSNGDLPYIFLRGCGFSDSEIVASRLSRSGLDRTKVTSIAYELINTYCGEDIIFNTCFISYSNNDKDFAQRLYNDLQSVGVRCWFAPEDLKIGDRFRLRIDQEIRLRDKFLVIISSNSINSEWVGDEVEAALEEEIASQRTILFPLRLDDTVMTSRQDWAAKIKRRRHIGDFVDWRNPKKYEKSFKRLLDDLRMS